MIVIKQHGSFKNTENFFKKNSKRDLMSFLKKKGEEGVRALKRSTPVRTGYTASCWDFNVKKTKNGYVIEWTNSNVVNGVPIAVILQYGHATKNGGFVQGIDYINPALQPIFDEIADESWKEVVKS